MNIECAPAKRVVICLLAVLMCFGLMPAASAVKLNDFTVRDYGVTSEQVSVSDITMLDKDGNRIPIGQGLDQAAINAHLLSTITDGKMAANKYGYFEDVADAEKGVAKIVFDMAGKPIADGVDVLFVLDRSGSMNMWQAKFTDGFPWLNEVGHCLNPAHYYRVPAGLMGNAEDVFFNASEEFGTSLWKLTTRAQWDAFCAKYAFPSPATSMYNAVMGSNAAGQKWNMQENHYRMQGDAYVQIPCTIDYTDSNGRPFDSPSVDNPDQCYDRMVMMDQMCAELAERLLTSTIAVNRVGGVSFSQSVKNTLPITNILSDVNAFLDITKGGDYTNYKAALDGARRLIAGRTGQFATRPVYVVFISDGMPNWDTDGTKIPDAIAGLKRTGAVIYAIGIEIGQNKYLEDISNGPGYFKDCDSVEDFEAYMAAVSDSILNPLVTKLTDTLGQDYTFLCDAEHPFTIGGTAYTSLSSIPKDKMTFSNDGKTFTWSGGVISANGFRVSFYTKLADTVLHQTGGHVIKDTNAAASATYFAAKLENNVAVFEKTPTVITLRSPAIQVDNSILTARKTSDKMTSNNPAIMGQRVYKDDNITYTLHLTNTGVLDLKDVVVADKIPAGMAYVSGGTPSADKSMVRFAIPALGKGATTTVSFVARVLGTTRTVENTGLFGLTEATDSIKGGAPVCKTNTLINPLYDDSGEPGPVEPSDPYPSNPPGGLTVTKTITGQIDPAKAFPFTLTLDDRRINGRHGDMTFVDGVAGFTLRAGGEQDRYGLDSRYRLYGDGGQLWLHRAGQRHGRRRGRRKNSGRHEPDGHLPQRPASPPAFHGRRALCGAGGGAAIAVLCQHAL